MMAPLFIELQPSMRRSIESAIESLITLLDEFEGDPDIEDDDQDEAHDGRAPEEYW